MKQTVFLILWMALCHTGYTSPGPNTSITASLVLKVSDKELSAQKLIDKAEILGGYYLSQSKNRIVIKLANKHVRTFLGFCDSLGFVIDRSYNAKDYIWEAADHSARLRAKRELLKNYFAMLDSSDVKSVFTVEKVIIKMQEEVESLMADIKIMNHEIAFAEITVDFRFQSRTAPLKSDHSVFGWLNELNLSDLQEDFQ